jgi:prepilin signal peptidase PulO-like enzyme (type II secretory pathway)
VLGELLPLLQVLSSTLFLLVLGAEDLKTRELSSRVVYAYLSTGVVLYVLTLLTARSLLEVLVYTAFTLAVTPGFFFVLYKYKFTGDGDVYTSLALGLALYHPLAYRATLVKQGVLPPALMVVLYASITAALYSLLHGVLNILRHRDLLAQVPAKYKALLVVTATPVKAGEYAENPKYKYYYPVQVFEVTSQGLEVKFNLAGLSDTARERVLELVERSIIPRDYVLWVTPGLPYVFYMLLGLVVVVLLGDKPIYHLLAKILGV